MVKQKKACPSDPRVSRSCVWFPRPRPRFLLACHTPADAVYLSEPDVHGEVVKIDEARSSSPVTKPTKRVARRPQTPHKESLATLFTHFFKDIRPWRLFSFMPLFLLCPIRRPPGVFSFESIRSLGRSYCIAVQRHSIDNSLKRCIFQNAERHLPNSAGFYAWAAADR
jgi:hypothetical protein